jgi:hypothetical protein
MELTICIVTLTECAQGIVLCFFIWILQKSQKEDAEAIDENVITLSDYSVEIKNLGHFVNDKKYAATSGDGSASKNNELMKKDLKNHFEEYLSTRPHIGKDEDSIIKNKDGIKVHEVNFGKADGACIHYKVRRGKIIKKIAHLVGEVKKATDSKKKNKEKKLKSLKEKIEKFEKAKLGVESKLEKLKEHKSMNDPITAYVTFATNQGFIRCVDNYPKQTCAWCCMPCCKGKKALINGKYRIWLDVAPEAENIWWENLATGSKMRAVRQLISTLITLALLIASIAGVSVVKSYNARLGRLYPPVDCKTMTEKYNGEITKSDVVLDEMLLSRVETNYTFTSANATDNAMNIQFVEKVTKDSLLQCYCSNIIGNPLIYGDFRSSKYFFNPYNDIENISLSNATINTPHASDYPNGDWCVKYAFDYGEIQALTVGGVMLVVVINIVLKMVMKNLVRFEHPQSKSEYSVSLARKLFIVQLINTAAILLIVNGNLNSMGINNGLLDGLIFGGDYDDFNSQWYGTVGSSLVLTMLINMLTPLYSPVGNCVTRGLKRAGDRAKCLKCCCQDRQYSKKLTQAEYESLWNGGDFELPNRYGALQMVYWVTLIYGTGLPILYPMAFCYFTLAYWVDKWALTKLYNKPMQTDEKVAASVTGNMTYAILVHVMFATWKYSNSKIFQGVNVMENMMAAAGSNPPQSLIDITDVIKCGTGGGLSFALTRIVLTAPHLFALSLLLILFLIIYRIILPIFGTLLLIAFPCLGLCFSHLEEDTALTVEEAIKQKKMQGAKSYDITANRQYAELFALEEEEAIEEAVHEGDIEMVVVNESGGLG